jgi:hypothetical protein
MNSFLICNNTQNLATRDLAIFEVAHPHSVPSKPDSPSVGLICGARPLAEVILMLILTIPSHFEVFTEENMHILIVLPVRNHVENLSHILVEPVAVYQICVRDVSGRIVSLALLCVFSLFWLLFCTWFGIRCQLWLI